MARSFLYELLGHDPLPGDPLCIVSCTGEAPHTAAPCIAFRCSGVFAFRRMAARTNGLKASLTGKVNAASRRPDFCCDACGRCGNCRRRIRRNHPKDVIASAGATKALLQNGCGPKAKIRSRPGLPLPAPVPKSPDRGFGSTTSVREPMQTTTKTTITKTMSLPIAKRPHRMPHLV